MTVKRLEKPYHTRYPTVLAWAGAMEEYAGALELLLATADERINNLVKVIEAQDAELQRRRSLMGAL